jgi:hypothetical protein
MLSDNETLVAAIMSEVQVVLFPPGSKIDSADRNELVIRLSRLLHNYYEARNGSS